MSGDIEETRTAAITSLQRLEAITAMVREQSGVNLEPMQLAALLLEKSTERLSRDEAINLAGVR